ncbi:MAG: putative ABC transporter permease [Christensenellaceae bacterium]
MFFTISFLGWCLEVITCSSGFKYFSDRGFLTLPFCVIYGTPLCLIFLILGTPREGVLANVVEKTRLRKAGKIFLRYFLYFLLSAAIATLFELVFGLLFDSLGVRLWNYYRFPHNFKGYICPQFFFIWGALITLAVSAFLCRCIGRFRVFPGRPRRSQMLFSGSPLSPIFFQYGLSAAGGHHFDLAFRWFSAFFKYMR